MPCFYRNFGGGVGKGRSASSERNLILRREMLGKPTVMAFPTIHYRACNRVSSGYKCHPGYLLAVKLPARNRLFLCLSVLVCKLKI